jgi:hypothetical protein
MLSEARREKFWAIAQSLVCIPSPAGEECAVIEQTVMPGGASWATMTFNWTLDVQLDT